MVSILPNFRRTIPKLSRDFFICHQCLKPSLPVRRIPPNSPLSSKKSIRFNSSASAFQGIVPPTPKSPLNSLSETISAKSSQGKAGKEKVKRAFFPDTTSRPVAYWLLGSAASVFGIVVFGGLTRLTESGYLLLFYLLLLCIANWCKIV